MQSTEEYLDQLLASVSEDAEEQNKNAGHKAHKSIEDLDESELTEEALQHQLALLLGLETEQDTVDYEEDDDFMSQYTNQMVEELNEDAAPVAEPENYEVMDIPDDFSVVDMLSEPDAQEEILQEMNTVEDVTTAVETSAPEISSTGVLSADEIAALFASMENEQEEELSEEPAAEEIVEVVQEAPAPPISDSGVLSPDEIAALFASMEAEAAEESATEDTDVHEEPVKVAEIITEDVVEQKSTVAEDSGLTREELEELGLGDIADILVDAEAERLEEIVQEDAEDIVIEPENQIVEIEDFGFDEEMLLDIDNIDAMLEATAKLAEEGQKEESDNTDEQVEEDIMSMLAQFEEESVQESLANEAASIKAAEEAVNLALEEESNTEELAEAENEGKQKKAKKQKVKKEKVKKVKEPKEPKEKSNKPSIKEKLFAFMFEEESLDSEEPVLEVAEGGEMDELLGEKPVKAKKEKPAKKEKKSKKKAKEAADENAAIAAELEEEDKKNKKKEKKVKEKKAKKVVIAEKKQADEEESRRASKHTIGTKGIVATLLVCASLLGLILVGTYFLPKQLSLMAARVAFYSQDYEEAAMRFKGQNLNDSDQIMYEKATLLFGLQERYHQYEIYVQRGMSKDALDTLLQGVIACNEEEMLAAQLGIDTEWRVIKQQFMDALQAQYGLDETTAETVCGLRNPDYTVAVENILAGRNYNDMSAFGGTVSEGQDANQEEDSATGTGEDGMEQNGLNPEEMEDLLPEEEELLEQLQQQNAEGEEESSANPDEDNKELFSGSVEGGAVNFVE